MTRTTTRGDDGTIPTEPTHTSEPSYPFIDAVTLDVFDYPGNTRYAEVLLQFNYGPHACSTGAFDLKLEVYDTNKQWPVRSTSGPLGPTAHDAIEAVRGRDLPQHIEDALIDALENYTPDSSLAPGWPNRDDIPSLADSRDNHSTTDPRFLDDHPNLTTTDDGTLGEYRIPSADTDGVAVHRPSWKHRDIDRSDYEWGVTGDGHETTPVTEIRVDGEAFDKATAPPVVGWFRRFYPNATVTIDDGVAHITTENGREWLPQGQR